MNPIRVADLGVEPVSLSEMRAHLRLGSDETAEDALVSALIAGARAAVEAASRRLLRRARFRAILPSWPGDGLLPLPLSPLVAVERVGLIEATGTVTEIAAPVRLGADPWDAPCLMFGTRRSGACRPHRPRRAHRRLRRRRPAGPGAADAGRAPDGGGLVREPRRRGRRRRAPHAPCRGGRALRCLPTDAAVAGIPDAIPAFPSIGDPAP